MSVKRILGVFILVCWSGPAAELIPLRSDGGALAGFDLSRVAPFNHLLVNQNGALPFERLNRETKSPVLIISDGVWPGIRAVEADAATATPSTEPWIDSNIWMLRSVRAWCGNRPVWLLHDPPKDAAESGYLRAVAEAVLAGGWFAVPLHAVERWPRIAGYARFFEAHAEWRSFQAFGPLGIVQDSLLKDRFQSGENLNLIARRGIPYRIIERPALSAGTTAGLKALLAVDLAPPTPAERAVLAAFRAAGGTLIDGEHEPEALSKEMIEFVGDENLGVRIFNAPSVLGYAAQSEDGARILLHLLNYASVPAENITLRVEGGFRRARLYMPEAGPVDLKVDRSGGRTEVSVPRLPIYAAVVWEGGSHDRKPKSDAP